MEHDGRREVDKAGVLDKVMILEGGVTFRVLEINQLIG